MLRLNANHYDRDRTIEFGRYGQHNFTVQRLFTGSNNISKEDGKKIALPYVSQKVRENNLSPQIVEVRKDLSYHMWNIGETEFTAAQKTIEYYNSKPEYIEWLMKKADMFYLIEEEIPYLQSLKCYTIDKVNIKSIEIREDIDMFYFSYEILFEEKYFKFSDYAIKQNRKHNMRNRF